VDSDDAIYSEPEPTGRSNSHFFVVFSLALRQMAAVQDVPLPRNFKLLEEYDCAIGKKGSMRSCFNLIAALEGERHVESFDLFLQRLC
jgi:hypothetical protein